MILLMMLEVYLKLLELLLLALKEKLIEILYNPLLALSTEHISAVHI